MIIQNPLLTGSLNYNGADLSNVTSSNANSASVSLILTAVSSSNQQLSASYIALSASYNVFSGSASTRITTVSSSQQDISSSLLQVSASYIALSGSYNTFSGSASTRVTQIENNYATTGSNSFRADQSITGSLVVSSTITAQTLVVQTVTSSIVYSSGSNVFGNQLANTQTFTGSVNITGSLAIAGNITSNGTAVVLGSGTSGYLPKFTGTSALGNSLIYDSGTNVGIGTASPNGKLTINSSSDNNLRLENGSELAIIRVLTTGALDIWSHGDTANEIFFRQGTGSGTVKMTLDVSGSLGLGVTPSAWLSGVRAIQIGVLGGTVITGNTTEGGTSTFGQNWYYDTSFKYAANGTSTYYAQGSGQHIWYQAPNNVSGAGAALTFTQAMTLFANGNLAVGTTTDSGYKLDVNGTGRFSGALTGIGATFTGAASSILNVRSTSASSYATTDYYNSSNTQVASFGYGNASVGATAVQNAAYIYTLAGVDFVGYMGGAERMRITSGGAITISTPTSGQALTIAGLNNNWTQAINGSSTTGQSYGLLVTAGTNSSDNSFYVENKAANTIYFRVRGDGYLQSPSTYNNTTASPNYLSISTSGFFERYVASSARYKEEIKDWDVNGLDIILALRPRTYKYKKEYYNKADVDFLGLIAEEVAEVNTYLADYENEDGTGQVENVRYATIVVPLIKAIQELKATNDDLQTQINQLKAR